MLKFLNNHSFYHGCINPNNILISTSNQILQITLINITFSDNNEFSDLKWFTTRQSAIFAAPEVLNTKTASFKSDIYSLGVLMYFLTFYQDLFTEEQMASEEVLNAVLR